MTKKYRKNCKMLMLDAKIFCNFNFACFERQQRNRKIFMPLKFLAFK